MQGKMKAGQTPKEYRLFPLHKRPLTTPHSVFRNMTPSLRTLRTAPPPTLSELLRNNKDAELHSLPTSLTWDS